MTTQLVTWPDRNNWRNILCPVSNDHFPDLVLMIRKSGLQLHRAPSSAEKCISKSSAPLKSASHRSASKYCASYHCAQKCGSAKVQSSDAVSIAKLHPTKLHPPIPPYPPNLLDAFKLGCSARCRNGTTWCALNCIPCRRHPQCQPF